MKVHVYGAAGYNLGDDAIALTARKALTDGERYNGNPSPSVTLAEAAGSGFGQRYGLPTVVINRRSPIGMLRLVDSIRSADVVVLGGGSLIQDKLGLSRLRGMLAYVKQVVSTAKAFGKPLLSLGLGVDELQTELGRSIAAQVLPRFDLLVVRDERSLELAHEYSSGNLKSAVAAADPAYLFSGRDAPTARHPEPAQKVRYAVVSLVNEGLQLEALLNRLAATLGELIGQNLVDEVVLLAMDRRANEEREVFERLLTKLSQLATKVRVVVPDDAGHALNVVRGASLVIAMRLHAMIFAVGKVPLVGISRTTKTDTFIKDAGLRSLDLASSAVDTSLDQALEALKDTAALQRQAGFRSKQELSASSGLDLLTYTLSHMAPRGSR